MSEEPTPPVIARTGSFFEAARRGDLDIALAHCSPDAVFDMSTVGLGTYVGPETIRRFWEDWLSAYDESELEAEEIVQLSGRIVLVVFRQRARPAGSSGRVELRTTWVFEWEGEKIHRVTNYPAVEAGRAAAERLAEEAA